MQSECFEEGSNGLAGKGRSQQVGQVVGLFFNGPPPPYIQVLLRDQPKQEGRAADGVYDRAPDCRSAIVCHSGTARAKKQALVVTAVWILSEVTQDGHHSALCLADIPASAIVEDRNVDLRRGEVHGCVLFQSKCRKWFELQHYAWVGHECRHSCMDPGHATC